MARGQFRATVVRTNSIPKRRRKPGRDGAGSRRSAQRRGNSRQGNSTFTRIEIGRTGQARDANASAARPRMDGPASLAKFNAATRAISLHAPVRALGYDISAAGRKLRDSRDVPNLNVPPVRV